MLLSARMLNSVVSVKSWDYADAAEFTQGDTFITARKPAARVAKTATDE